MWHLLSIIFVLTKFHSGTREKQKNKVFKLLFHTFWSLPKVIDIYETFILGLYWVFDRELALPKFCKSYFACTTLVSQGSHLSKNIWILWKIVVNCDYFRHFFHISCKLSHQQIYLLIIKNMFFNANTTSDY